MGSPRRGEQVARDIDEVADSSADEHTAIMRPGKSLSSKPGYGSTGVDNGGAAGESSGPPKQRKIPPRGEQNTTPNEEEEPGGWLRALADKYGSVELENNGSVARDHLALERTFLAWLRTSLSFASIGIAVTQLFRLNTAITSSDPDAVVSFAAAAKLRSVGKPLGATFLAISILILVLGFHRYFESQHYVIRGKFPASRGTILIVSFVAAALIIASLVVVIAIAPHAFEK